jgi:hypothetical protein
MNLAYPQIWHALSDLLRDGVGLPSIELIDCGHLGLLDQVVTFGAVQQIVYKTYNGRAFGIGFINDQKLTLSPLPSAKIKWDSGDRIVAVVRRM